MLFLASMVCAGIGFAFVFSGDTQSAKLAAGGCFFFLVADRLAAGRGSGR